MCFTTLEVDDKDNLNPDRLDWLKLLCGLSKSMHFSEGNVLLKSSGELDELDILLYILKASTEYNEQDSDEALLKVFDNKVSFPYDMTMQS